MLPLVPIRKGIIVICANVLLATRFFTFLNRDLELLHEGYLIGREREVFS